MEREQQVPNGLSDLTRLCDTVIEQEVSDTRIVIGAAMEKAQERDLGEACTKDLG